MRCFCPTCSHPSLLFELGRSWWHIRTFFLSQLRAEGPTPKGGISTPPSERDLSFAIDPGACSPETAVQAYPGSAKQVKRSCRGTGRPKLSGWPASWQCAFARSVRNSGESFALRRTIGCPSRLLQLAQAKAKARSRNLPELQQIFLLPRESRSLGRLSTWSCSSRLGAWHSFASVLCRVCQDCEQRWHRRFEDAKRQEDAGHARWALEQTRSLS